MAGGDQVTRAAVERDVEFADWESASLERSARNNRSAIPRPRPGARYARVENCRSKKARAAVRILRLQAEALRQTFHRAP